MSDDKRGKTVKWRRSNRLLTTKPIYRNEFPKILELMQKDELLPLLTDDGLKWYHGRYEITPKVVREVWYFSIAQYKRLVNYILEEGVCDWE